MEDEAVVARDIQMQLDAMGFDPVGHAASGEDAIALADTLRPDLVVMDIQLAGAMDGIAAARIIRARFGVPVVFLTAYATDDILSRAAETAASGYIIKPFHEREMRAVLALALYKHQAEAALQRSEATMEQAFGASPIGMALVALDGRFLRVNAAFCAMLGRTEAQFQSTDFQHVTHPDDVAADVQFSQEVLAGARPSFQMAKRYVHHDGRIVWAQLDVTLVRDAGGAPLHFVAQVQDITEQHQAGEALRRSEAVHAKMVANIGDVIVIVDRQGINRYKSPNVERVFGWKPEELVGTGAFDNVHPDDAHALHNVFGALARAPGSAGTTQFRYRCKDGRYKWVEISVVNLLDDPDINGILGNYQDITERKLAATALQDSETRYRNLFEEAGDGIFYFSADDGRIIQANQAFARMHGYTVAELQGMSLQALDTPESARLAPERIARLLAGESMHFEVTHLHKDGHAFPMEVSASLVVAGERLIQGFHRDITERRRAESEQEKLQAQLLQAQKMESVGRLAGGVAHDFNNMLAVILGTTDVAMEQLDPSNPVYGDLQEIRAAAERSADLTRELLTFARKQTVAPQVLNLNDSVPSLLAMLRRLIGEDIRLVWRPDPMLWSILMDPSQFGHILTNLCVNARDAIADVGTVTIETTNCVFDESFCERHADATPGEYVRVTVTDDGTGMSGDVLTQLFEPFFTTKKAGEGTGLGLATVYGAVRQNLGFITVSSTIGQGATFELHFPRHIGVLKSARRSGALAIPVGGQETILIVEDEPSILRLTTRVLEAQGYAVLGAGSPDEAIRLAKEHPGDINLLLTDVVMPAMNGRDLTNALLKIRPTIRPLFMSGHTADVIANRGMLITGVSFLQKPFSTRALTDKVREVLDAVIVPDAPGPSS